MTIQSSVWVHSAGVSILSQKIPFVSYVALFGQTKVDRVWHKSREFLEKKIPSIWAKYSVP